MKEQNEINYYKLYIKDSNKIDFMTTNETTSCIQTATLKIPMLVSRMWSVKQIGELPDISIYDQDINEVFGEDVLKDIFKPVNALMGLGRVFLVPYLTNKDQLKYDIVIEEKDNVVYFEKDDELLMLNYNRKEKIMVAGKITTETVFYNHYIDNDVYYFKKYYLSKGKIVYLDDKDGSLPISKEGMMLPFKIDLSLTFEDKGIPVWANAYRQIQDAYDAYTEMLSVMQRLTPIVGIPSALKSEREKVTSLSGYSKMFALVPSLSDSMEWKYFGGGYSPEPYIKHIDFILNNVSLHCGLGNRTLSYDQVTGVLKTATEVVFSNNDLMINQSLINQTVNDMLARLMKSYYYMINEQWLDDNDINITFEDAVFNTKEAYQEQLKNDIIQKNISTEFYLQEMYPNQNIEEIKGDGLQVEFDLMSDI